MPPFGTKPLRAVPPVTMSGICVAEISPRPASRAWICPISFSRVLVIVTLLLFSPPLPMNALCVAAVLGGRGSGCSTAAAVAFAATAAAAAAVVAFAALASVLFSSTDGGRLGSGTGAALVPLLDMPSMKPARTWSCNERTCDH